MDGTNIVAFILYMSITVQIISSVPLKIIPEDRLDERSPNDLSPISKDEQLLIQSRILCLLLLKPLLASLFFHKFPKPVPYHPVPGLTRPQGPGGEEVPLGEDGQPVGKGGEDDKPKDEDKGGDKPKDEDKEGDKPKDEDKEGDKPKDEDKEGDKPKDEDKEGDKPKDEDKEGDKPKDEDKEGDKPKDEDKEGGGNKPEEDKEPEAEKPGDDDKKIVIL